MGKSVFPRWIISGTSSPRKAGPLPQARECLPPFVGRRGPFSPGESNPPDTLVYSSRRPVAGPGWPLGCHRLVLDVGTHFQNRLLQKTGRCAGWWAGGAHQRCLSQSWKPRHCPLGRQRLTGLTAMTYCNRTMGMANLQRLIFIPITAFGILIR